jgi:hypothetical protein
MDVTLPNPTRRCSTTGKELRPGESYHGAVIEQGGRLARHDYAPEAWSGPPKDAVGFWQGRVPIDGPRRMVIDDEVLLQCFHRTDDAATGNAARLRFVLALLLIRRKRLKQTDSRTDDIGEVLILEEPKSNTRYEVRDPKLSSNELLAVQNEVFQLLGWD